MSQSLHGKQSALDALTKWRLTARQWDALQLADCEDALVQSALIAARISNYGCHRRADAPKRNTAAATVWIASTLL